MHGSGSCAERLIPNTGAARWAIEVSTALMSRRPRCSNVSLQGRNVMAIRNGAKRAGAWVKVPVGVIAVLGLASAGASAQDAREQISSFAGSFETTVPMEVPGFHGLEPRIALAYTSEGRNGFSGVGWGLAG